MRFGFALVAATVFHDQKAIAIFSVVTIALAGDDDTKPLMLHTLNKNVFDQIAKLIEAFDEKYPVRTAGFLKDTRCDGG